MSDDPQDQAEGLDEDVIDATDDYSGDEFGDGLPSFPPDRAVGANADEDESFADRDAQLEPEVFDQVGGELVEGSDDFVGQIVDEGGALGDTDRVIADEESGIDPSPEARALHIEHVPLDPADG